MRNLIIVLKIDCVLNKCACMLKEKQISTENQVSQMIALQCLRIYRFQSIGSGFPCVCFLLFNVVTCNDFGAVCNRTSEYQSIRLVKKILQRYHCWFCICCSYPCMFSKKSILESILHFYLKSKDTWCDSIVFCCECILYVFGIDDGRKSATNATIDAALVETVPTSYCSTRLSGLWKCTTGDEM